jgi:hypothetical protein
MHKLIKYLKFHLKDKNIFFYLKYNHIPDLDLKILESAAFANN